MFVILPATNSPLCVFVVLLCVFNPLSARAAHPLITEDTGTQGQGHFQLELIGEHTTLRDGGANQLLTLTATALSYGVVDSVDVILSLPYLRLGDSGANGTPAVRGLTDLGMDVKWRFYEWKAPTHGVPAHFSLASRW